MTDVYLLDVIQSQRSGLSEDLDADAVTRVLQDQTSDIKPPADRSIYSREEYLSTTTLLHSVRNETEQQVIQYISLQTILS